MKEIIIIGGGLAGCEAAFQIAKQKIPVKLYEMKPHKYSEAHNNKNLAEIVCSNSFKSDNITNACGLLKEELRRLGSILIPIADKVKVPAGQALAVDRERFAEEVTKAIENNPYIEVIREEVEEIPKDSIVIIATGPLTSEKMSNEISKITGQDKLFFYDAAAPIVEKETINMDIGFYGNRYEQERPKEESIEEWKERIQKEKKEFEKINSENRELEKSEYKQDVQNNIVKIVEASYINLPMNKEEYTKFYNELINAEIVTLHEFEKREIFEGCMPLEIMAKRGEETLRFGPLKPVGFTDPRTGMRPYAIVQLRQDNTEGTLFNLVGFQTNLKFGEQKRVFSLIPGLENANFVKYGVMHRNTYINSTTLLDETYNLKSNRNIFFAGQITGVEGYVESISSGFVAGKNAIKLWEIYNEKINLIHEDCKKDTDADIQGNYDFETMIKKHEEVVLEEYSKNKIIYPKETVIGALAKYISTPNESFQPMNANFGILPELEEKIKDKKLKYQKLAEISLNLTKAYK